MNDTVTPAPPAGAYNKLAVAALTAAAAILTAANVAGTDWALVYGTAISTVIAAVGVYITENTVNAAASKFWASALGAVGIGLSGLLSGTEIRSTSIVVLSAVIGAGMVYLTPNAIPASPLTVEPKV